MVQSLDLVRISTVQTTDFMGIPQIYLNPQADLGVISSTLSGCQFDSWDS